jgi:hypothetical protein
MEAQIKDDHTEILELEQKITELTGIGRENSVMIEVLRRK